MNPGFESTAILGTAWAPRQQGPVARMLQAAMDALGAAGRGEWRRSAEREWIDAPSGLHNLAGLTQAGEALLEQCRRTGRAVSLVVLDFDDLLEVNGIYGREASREALQRVVRKLRRIAGSRGIAARTGRTRFAVLLPGVDREAAQAVVQRVLGRPSRIEFDFAGDEIVVVPDIQCEQLAEAMETVEQLHRDIAENLAEERALEARRCVWLQRERERHSRPMGVSTL